MNKTKKSLLASGLFLVVSAALLVGTTFAWFTDSVANKGNVIQAGTLDIKLNDGVETELFNSDGFLFEPERSQKATAKVTNEGSLWLKYTMSFENVVIADTVGEDSDITKVLDVYTVAADAADLTGATKLGTMADLMAAGSFGAKDAVLAPKGQTGTVNAETVDDTDTFTLVIKMQESAGNEYQGASVSFDVVMKATQFTYEEDGFGNNQYDAGAHPTAVFGKDILDSLNSPDVTEVVAGGNIDMNDPVFDDANGNDTFVIPDGKTLDMNQNSFIRPAAGGGSGFAIESGSTAVVKNGTFYNEGDMTLVDVEYGASITFENINFIGHGSDTIKVRANGNGEKATLVFKNCTFDNAPVVFSGMNGASEIDVQFIGCDFSGTYKMYDEDGNVLTDPYGHIHYTDVLVAAESYYLYGNINFKDCTFDLDCSEARYKEEIVSLYGYGYDDTGKMLNVSLENVTMTGKKVVPVKIDRRYEDGLNFTQNGTTYTIDGQSVNYDGTAK